MGLQDDDEWEYEYHETETEDFYVTLDLTSRVPDALTKTAGKNAANAAQQKQPDGIEASVDRDPLDDNGQPTSTLPTEELQILDLHSFDPLVKFEDAIYRCAWSTDYGSQLYIAKAGTFADPAYAGHVLDIVASSRVRLVAQPAGIRRKEVFSPPPEAVTSSKSEDARPTEGAPKLLSSQEPMNKQHDDATPESAHQIPETDSLASAFIARFAAIKKARGENDHVPTYSIKIYDPPSAEEQERIRAAALAADAEAVQQKQLPKQPLLDHMAYKPVRKRRRFARKNVPDEGDPQTAAPMMYDKTPRGKGGGAYSRERLAASVGFVDDGAPTGLRARRVRGGKRAKRAASEDDSNEDDDDLLMDEEDESDQDGDEAAEGEDDEE